jgi:hypothetical protein
MKSKITWQSIKERFAGFVEGLWEIYFFCAALALPAGVVVGYPVFFFIGLNSPPKDANGDGVVTISDVWIKAQDTFQSGTLSVLNSGDGRYLRFFEIDPQAPGGVVFFLFCLVHWFFIGFGIVAAAMIFVLLAMVTGLMGSDQSKDP